jgi:two-component system sensor kinase FixL
VPQAATGARPRANRTRGELSLLHRRHDEPGGGLDPDEAVAHRLNAGQALGGDEAIFVGIIHDITGRKEAEIALCESELRWRSIVDTVPDAIIVIDAHGAVESFSPAAERLFGYPAAEVLGRNVNMLMPSPYREAHDGYLTRYMRTGKRRIIGIGRIVVGRRKDGETCPIEPVLFSKA